jgi:hypothetical protein
MPNEIQFAPAERTAVVFVWDTESASAMANHPEAADGCLQVAR